MAHDIRQRAPFRTVAQEALIALLRTASDARHFMGGVVGPEGITFQQYNVLRILRGAGPEGLPTLDIGDRMIDRRPSVTRIIDRLVTKGLAERERCTEDRRRVWCRITAEGMALVARLDPAVARADVDATTGLSEVQQAELITLLDRLRAGLTGPAG